MLGIIFLSAFVAYAAYENYRLWTDPEGHWKRSTGRAARFRAKTRGTILSLFDVGGYSDRHRYIRSMRIGMLIFMIWGLFLLVVAIFNMK